MIIDASALLAIALDEPDGPRFTEAILNAEQPRMPAVTWFEAALVVGARGDALAVARFDDINRDLGITLIDFTAEHAGLARAARRMYGRGRHPARLNFGDCMVYAVAKAGNEPLLFKGNDFTHTDIEPALKD